MNREADAGAVISPVTSGAAHLETSLDVETIVRRYAAIGLDVAQTFDGMDTVAIYRCDDTGYRFFHPPSLAGEADFYEQLHRAEAGGSGNHEYRAWSEDFDFAFRRLVPGERLIDVGCGDGAFLKRASAVANVTGIDGSSYAKGLGETLGLDIRHGMIADFAEEFAGAFDTACGFQILEHVYEVAPFVRQLKSLMKPGGRMILAVPNNEPFIRRFDPYAPLNCPPHHIGLWDRASLEKMAAYFGLVPTEHRYCEVSGRWTVEAYLHARSMLDIRSDIGRHSVGEKLKMLALAPFTVPLSLARHVRTRGRGTRNVIVMTFRSAHDGSAQIGA